MTKVQQKSLAQIITEKVKKNKKRYLVSFIAIIIVIIGSVLLYNFTTSKAIDTTTLLSDQVVDNLKFMKTKLENNKLTVVVYNQLEESYNLKTIDVEFQDENYNKITTVRGYIGESIDNKDMKQLVVSTDVDLSNASHIKYIINKEQKGYNSNML